MSGSYLACLCTMACLGNMSWQYVNSMNRSVLEEGVVDGMLWLGAPMMQRMYGLNFGRH